MPWSVACRLLINNKGAEIDPPWYFTPNRVSIAMSLIFQVTEITGG